MAVFAVDRFTHFVFGDITLAPLLAILALSGSAFFLKPRYILLWTPWYALLCFLLLTYWRHSFVPDGLRAEVVWDGQFAITRGFVRSLTVLLAGGLCALLSQQRQRLERSLEETVAVMAALPLGVVISDRSGLISFANEKAALLLHKPVADLVGSSFFSLLASAEGNMIERYSSLSEVPGENSGRIFLHLRANPAVRFAVRLFSLQSPAGRLVATVFDESPDGP